MFNKEHRGIDIMNMLKDKIAKASIDDLTKSTNKINDDKLVKLTIEVPEDLRRKFKAKCATDGLDMREVLTPFIEQYVR